MLIYNDNKFNKQTNISTKDEIRMHTHAKILNRAKNTIKLS